MRKIGQKEALMQSGLLNRQWKQAHTTISTEYRNIKTEVMPSSGVRCRPERRVIFTPTAMAARM